MCSASRFKEDVTARISFFLLIILGSLFIFLSGCGDHHNPQRTEEPDGVSFRWHIHHPDSNVGEGTISRASVWEKCEDIATVQAIVYEEGADREPITSEEVSCAKGKGEMAGLKPDTDLRVVLVGFDTDGEPIYRGELDKPFTISPGEEKKIDPIDIYPMVPHSSSFEVETAHDRITVSWDKSEPGAGIYSYGLYMDNIKLKSPPITVHGESETVTVTVAPLKPGFEYCFSVSAVDAFGYASKPSSPVCGATPRRYTKLDADGNDLDTGATDWEMVRDEETGLVWEAKKDTDPQLDFRSMRKLFSYDQTAGHIDDLDQSPIGGSRQWRVPNTKELHALVETELEHRGNSSTIAINETYFPNIHQGPSTRFWTSLVPASNSRAHWIVSFGDGGRIWGNEDNVPLRAVHGLEMPSPDYDQFTDNEDGTVTDNSTQLMWQRKAFTGADGQKLTWQEAAMKIDELNDQNFADHDDWRMPKIKELVSIMDFDLGDVRYINRDWFDNENPELVEHGCFWSSTGSHRKNSKTETDHEYVYIANFYGGEVFDNWDTVKPSPGNGNETKWTEKEYYVRAVRSITKVNVIPEDPGLDPGPDPDPGPGGAQPEGHLD